MITQKLARLRRDGQPRVLDLFSGCGGMMLGFHRANCVSVGGIELDPFAAGSYARNFHGGSTAHGVSRDITQERPKELLRDLGHEGGIDFIIGGPPCPAFTRVGRAKLREVALDPLAYLNDPRAGLYLHYLEFVRQLQPIGLLMENVPDVLNFGGRNVGEEIARTLVDAGYRCRYTLLNAASYGVPQMRERFFLMAIKKEALRDEVRFPLPTHHVQFPRGYASSRQVALKHVLASEASHYTNTPIAPPGSAKAVTVRQAIGDLPTFAGCDVQRRMQYSTARAYKPRRALSAFASLMRAWPEFEGCAVLADHDTRALSERDFRLFAEMQEGDDYPKAKALAQSLYENARPVNGKRPRKADYVPPYDENKFPNRWRKMESDEPARTLMAHLGKDSYSHIHYDSEQARTISVREAARLQSFPDGFEFCGRMNAAFRQIGNAVPPLLSYALAQSMVEQIGVAEKSSKESVEVA